MIGAREMSFVQALYSMYHLTTMHSVTDRQTDRQNKLWCQKSIILRAARSAKSDFYLYLYSRQIKLLSEPLV